MTRFAQRPLFVALSAALAFAVLAPAAHAQQDKASPTMREQRAKRWHRDPKFVPQVIAQVQRINLHLARSHNENRDLQDPLQDKQMPTIKIDNIDYDLDSLPDDAKAQLQSIQFVDQELIRLQAQVAAMQTARNAYVSALKAALPVVMGGDTTKLA